MLNFIKHWYTEILMSTVLIITLAGVIYLAMEPALRK